MSSKFSLNDVYQYLHTCHYFEVNDKIYIPLSKHYKNNKEYKHILTLYESLVLSPDNVTVFVQQFRNLEKKVAQNRKTYSKYLLSIIQDTM